MQLAVDLCDPCDIILTKKYQTWL